jgi:hypothetical protein
MFPCRRLLLRLAEPQAIDAEIAAFKPRVWTAPAPPFVSAKGAPDINAANP